MESRRAIIDKAQHLKRLKCEYMYKRNVIHVMLNVSVCMYYIRQNMLMHGIQMCHIYMYAKEHRDNTYIMRDTHIILFAILSMELIHFFEWNLRRNNTKLCENKN